MSINSGAKYQPRFDLLSINELRRLAKTLDAQLLATDISITYRNRCRRNIDLIADELENRLKRNKAS